VDKNKVQTKESTLQGTKSRRYSLRIIGLLLHIEINQKQTRKNNFTIRQNS